MNLDDLLPLLFVAVWVAGAVMRGRRSRGGRRGPRGPEAPRPTSSRPAAPTAAERREPSAPDAAGDGSRRTVQADADPVGDDAADDLRRRLEEARRRVREAMGEEVADAPSARREVESPPRPAPTPSARTDVPAGGLGREGAPSGRPAGRSVAPPGAPSTPTFSGGGLGREGLPPGPRPRHRTSGAGGLGREGTPRRRGASLGSTDDAPQVARRGATSASARLRAARALGRDRDDVVRGFVWSVVLGEPVARRTAGRRSTSPRP